MHPNERDFERRNRFVAILAGTLLVGLLASAGTGYSLVPVRDNLPAPNGEVRAMARANGTLYLGGQFSMVGPVAGPACAFDLVTAVVRTPSVRLIGHVNCTAPDGNGGWFLGGSFSSVQGQPRQNLAHIDPSGAVNSWNPGTDGIVQDIAVGGGVVYVVGPFTTVGGAARDNVAAIDAVTGAVTQWNPVQGTSAVPVACVEVGGGKVYLAGQFTTMSGQARQCLAEFTAVVPGDLSTGMLTGTFAAPDTLTTVDTLKLEGGMLFYDDFKNGSAGDNLFVRDLTADTLLYVLPANGLISDFAFDQTNGTLFACGNFTSIGGVARSHLAAIDIATGSATSWSVGADSFVQSLSLAHVNGVGELFMGGDFTSLGGVPRRGVGVVDPLAPAVISWNAVCDGNVDVVEVDGTKAFVAGDFRIVNGVPRSNLAAIDETNGTILNWSPTTNGVVHAMAVSGSTVYAGGGFTSVNGTTRNHVAGVDAATGALTSFNPNADDTVRAIAMASDGSTVYMGGDFTTVRVLDRPSLAAVNPTTGVPSAWNPSTDGVVNALLFLPGGIGSPVVIAGGAFSFANGVARNNFVSMDAQTGATLQLDPSPNGPVRALAFTPTDFGGFNQLYLGGDFTSVAGQPRNHIAMLIAFGALASWDPNADRPVYSILQVGNTVFAGGDFDFIGGQQRAGLAAIDINGAVTEWDSGIFQFTLPAFVNSLLENGGILYAGGQFRIGGSGRPNFAGFYDMVTAVADEPASKATPLALRVAPNPFDQSTTFQFSLPMAGEARVTVYDVTGRRVRELHSGWLSSGWHTMSWDGREDSGKPVAAGVYFLGVGTQAGTLGSKIYRVR